MRIYLVASGDAQDVLIPAREQIPAREGQGEVVEPGEPPAIPEAPLPGRTPVSGLREPRDAAVDAKGRVGVADFGNSRLRVFDAAGGLLGGWGGRGDGTYNLREPCAVAASGDDVYGADTWNGRVQRHAVNGNFRATAGGLYGPRGVAVAPGRAVWVTDTGNNRVVRYDAALAEPTFFGQQGSKPGEFSGRAGIAAGSKGEIFVADVLNHRIQILRPDGSFDRSIPFDGWGEPSEPHLEAAPDGTLYVTDPVASTLVAIDTAGRAVRTWKEDAAGQPVARPTGVAIDRARKKIWVVNFGSHTLLWLPLERP